MFDFVSLQIYDPERGKFIELHDFSSTVNPNTGELLRPRSGAIKYQYADRNMEFNSFLYDSGEVANYLRGSFHKYMNNGVHNASTFTYLDFVLIVLEFCIMYDIDPARATIHKLEFGFNLQVTREPQYYIDAARCYQRKKYDVETFRNGGVLLRFNKGAFKEIKIYDKSSQYDLEQNVLRFEIKLNKGKGAAKIGAKTLKDLLKYETTIKAIKELETALNQIVFLPQHEIETLSKKELDFYHRHRDRDTLNAIDCRHRFKRIRDRINGSFGAQVIQDLQESMSAEAAKVLELSKEKTQRFYHLQNEPLFKEWLTYCGNEVCNVFTPLYKGNMLHNDSRQCLITGNDISDQRKGSKFVSANKIGYKQAHDLRNQHSNPRNNLKRRLIRELEIPSLFNATETISLTKEQKELLRFWNGTGYLQGLERLIN